MFGKDKDPAKIGLTAHTAILHKLVSIGLEVLQPLSDDLRYDLAYYVEETAELVRIQCKAGRYNPDTGCIVFKNFNRSGGRGGKRSYIGDAEYFGVYCADMRKVYMIHVDECPVGETSLHLESTRKQGKNQFSTAMRWAKDYEI